MIHTLATKAFLIAYTGSRFQPLSMLLPSLIGPLATNADTWIMFSHEHFDLLWRSFAEFHVTDSSLVLLCDWAL